MSRVRFLLLALLLLVPAAAAQDPAPEDAAPPPAPAGADLFDLPAPEFRLTTLSGRTASRESYERRLLVLYFFEKNDVAAGVLASEIEFFFDQGRAEDIRYLGVSPLPEEGLRRFASDLDLQHDLASDPQGKVTRRFLGPDGGRAIVVLDGRGTVQFFRQKMDATVRPALRAVLGELLRELSAQLAALPRLDLPWRSDVPAPGFVGVDLDGKTWTLADFRGKPVLIYFFEYDCASCKKTTVDAREIWYRYRERGLRLVGVLSRGEKEELLEFRRTHGLTFPLLLDPERRMRRSFGAAGGDPDMLWIDAAGNARWREFGVPDNIQELLDLEARELLGGVDPATLSPSRYYGFRYCRVCHQAEFEDWLATPHAVAAHSLFPDRSYQRPDCAPCHVTGWKVPGAFNGPQDEGFFHVQCESCHGRAGGHLDTGERKPPWEARCLTCHIGPYVLKQEMEISLRWMNHRDTPDAETLFAYLPERRRDMERQRRSRRAVTTFRRGTPYVGSDACRPCHQEIHEQWSGSAHARALETLRGANRAGDPACLVCHVTALGETTGYRGAGTAAMAGVGCESCHGPGGDHVEAPASMASLTIYGLQDDCEPCRPEDTCRACHDASNDPDFKMPAALAGAAHRAK